MKPLPGHPGVHTAGIAFTKGPGVKQNKLSGLHEGRGEANFLQMPSESSSVQQIHLKPTKKPYSIDFDPVTWG